jgi:uncharacterized protein
MLLRFSVSNYLSLRREVTLLLAAGVNKELLHVVRKTPYVRHGVIPVAVIYGANAAGKSNVLSAIARMRLLVLNSFADGEEDSKLPHSPFALDESSRSAPTRFLIDFVLEGIRYQYGFAYTLNRIEAEWLYSFPRRARQVLFERRFDESRSQFKFGRSLLGANKNIQALTRANTLYLSAAAKAGHTLLSRIHSYFRDSLIVRMNLQPRPEQVVGDDLSAAPELVKELTRYLSWADTGISDIKLGSKELPENLRKTIGSFFDLMKADHPGAEYNVPEQMPTVNLGHAGSGGKIYYLDFGDESLGTRYLMTIVIPLLRAIKEGGVLVLDEITTGLHTSLARRLVELFQSPQFNTKGAQLIFSTHDTNILVPGLLRRDQIWFAEKAEDGETSLFPLTDFQTKNSDNIEKGYLSGRFGAVPYIPVSVES